MIHFFGNESAAVFAVESTSAFDTATIEKLSWLFGDATYIEKSALPDFFIGPRAAMITPWSTNAVEITQNMGIQGIKRIEAFENAASFSGDFDPMLLQKFAGLNQAIFTIHIQPEPILAITDIAAYNQQEGLALSDEEVVYLEQLAAKLGRPLTDSEVFGFSQVNSEHCRHKIFNGTFVIDGEEKPTSLFQLIKKTAEANPNTIVSAYKDNVAFLKGPRVEQFAPQSGDKPDFYTKKEFDAVISLKAETHNFPTTVEPFNGAATGSGGEIRDRLAGGQGSLPLAGTAVYMTSYSRNGEEKPWESAFAARPWLYQTPLDILIKASNGASDFGNKFGQPLIAGSVLTFEHQEEARQLGYDKVIMLAGGIGYAKAEQALKKHPQPGDKIVVLGGENYRIGMGGAAVSSADTGAFGSGIELNAIQRSNPEMQKRAANAIRAMVESDINPIVSIHDHGAGGHLNCLSELVEETGGVIDMDALPIGDPTLSAKEIIGNESQERIGLVIAEKDMEELARIAERERAPMYTVGEIKANGRFTFESSTTGEKPMDFALADMFGSSPKTIMADQTVSTQYSEAQFADQDFVQYLENVLQLEAVACKDWLTNKVDRCVGGRVAKQQCAGPLQLPLNNLGVMALDFNGRDGVATSIGHAPVVALIDAAEGSRMAIVEALTNIVWAPIPDGIKGVSLSANWMWACKNPGEDARLYQAVEACSSYAIGLGINIPTGKDSLSMKQKYKDQEVIAPGTVIISASAHTQAITKVVEPVAKKQGGSIYYIPFTQGEFALGGSSFYQTLNKVGAKAPQMAEPEQVVATFNALQTEIAQGTIAAGHDIGSGGLITTLLEMCFADPTIGMHLNWNALGTQSLSETAFAENPAVVIQTSAETAARLTAKGLTVIKLGEVTSTPTLTIDKAGQSVDLAIAHLRDVWFRTSYILDQKQSGAVKAKERFDNYKHQVLQFTFPTHFEGKLPPVGAKRPKAAIIREKGSNSEREMAHALYLAGFDVKDVHMTDLISGREDLQDVQFIGAVGGFSNSDVLGSAKGWAGAFKYNEKARKALHDFFARPNTLSVGICNGCQLFVELGLIQSEKGIAPKMLHNDSGKHESGFTSVTVQPNHSVMLSNLAGATLGVWISHGEGKFDLNSPESDYHIVGKYGYENYPANPNGSSHNTAMLCDTTGRHLVMMPHIERSIFPWNWAYYPEGRQDEVSPWLQAFVNAKEWILSQE